MYLASIDLNLSLDEDKVLLQEFSKALNYSLPNMLSYDLCSKGFIRVTYNDFTAFNKINPKLYEIRYANYDIKRTQTILSKEDLKDYLVLNRLFNTDFYDWLETRKDKEEFLWVF